VKPFEDLAQVVVNQTLAEIKHGSDCRLCLLQQSQLDCPGGQTMSAANQFYSLAA